ncbi:hypothetical protein JMG10_04415 [Nostoc ellipsosporum NOK]|nr:hypothetical protein [Nostoc ellipsosporum NOK]
MKQAIRLLFLLLLFSSCLYNPRRKPKPVSSVVKVTVSQPEAMDIAGRIEEAVNNNNANDYLSLFDPQLVADEANLIQATKLNAEDVSSLLPSLVDTSFLGPSRYKGHYQFVKREIRDSLQMLIFRMYTPAFADYHLYVLNKRENNPYLVEVFSFLNNSSLTKRLAAVFRAKTQGPNNERHYIAEENKINGMLIERRYEDALTSVWELLSNDTSRKGSVDLLLRTLCYVDPSQAAKEWEGVTATQASDYLLNLTIGEKTKDYSRAHRCITVLHQIFGDPFLDFYSGRLYREQKNYADAIGALTNLYEQFPLFDDGILELIRAYQESGNAAETNKWIKVYKTTLDADQGKLKILMTEKLRR